MSRAQQKLPRCVNVMGDDGVMVHYEGADGVNFGSGTLCGWDGGVLQTEFVSGPVECPECDSIVRFLWRLWHPRKPMPRGAA